MRNSNILRFRKKAIRSRCFHGGKSLRAGHLAADETRLLGIRERGDPCQLLNSFGADQSDDSDGHLLFLGRLCKRKK